MAASAQEGGEAFEVYQGSGPAQSEHYVDDTDGDMGYFDALAYSRRSPRGSLADSRSRTSQSLSQSAGPLSPGIASYNHQAFSAFNLHSHSMTPSTLSSHHDPAVTPRPAKKHKKTKNGSSAASFNVPSPSVEGSAGYP